MSCVLHGRLRLMTVNKNWHTCIEAVDYLNAFCMHNAKLLFDIRRSVLIVSRFFHSCIFHPLQFCAVFSSQSCIFMSRIFSGPLLTTNRNTYTRFRLVPKSMTWARFKFIYSLNSTKIAKYSLVMTRMPCRVAGCIIFVRRTQALVHLLTYLHTYTVGSSV